MDKLVLNVVLRTETGSGPARRLRRSGSIPCVIYGHGQNQKISLNLHDFTQMIHHMHSEHAIVTLNVDGNDLNVLIKDISREVVSHDIEHIDFMLVDLDEIVRVSVQVDTRGEADGVKNYGGVLELIQREVEIECKAKDIPETITMDVSRLSVHDVIRISDLPVLEGARYTGDPESVVITVAPPTVQVAETAAAGEEAPESAEPEVIGARKTEEQED